MSRGGGGFGGGAQGPAYGPQWSYGYTLGPGSYANNGDYTQWQDYNFYQQHRGGYGPAPGGPRGGRGGGSFRGRPGKTPEQPLAAAGDQPPPWVGPVPADEKPYEPAASVAAAAAAEKAKAAAAAVAKRKEEEALEDGELLERPMQEILRGRNPVTFCNEQAKIRNLQPIEWEQVSETGPPHEKIFTWSFKCGDMEVTGTANSKKNAKTAAAEEMARKFDQLPRAAYKRAHPVGGVHSGWGRGGAGGGGGGVEGSDGTWSHMPGYHRGRGGFRGGRGGNQPPWILAQQAKKRKKEADALADPEAAANKVVNPSQDNPVSKLYEMCKQRKQPEPIFETIAENVLESRKTTQGFTLKKTEFTIVCNHQGKKFSGVAMTKKQAKLKAAEACWAEVGIGGLKQSAIANMIQAQRSEVNAASAGKK